jgi:DNA-binding SARP family transcriptional activator
LGLAIHLLGSPRVERGGGAVPPPRGHKPWALLAYLLGTERPTTRHHLVSLLFGEADDPLGALRWNLSAVRRLLQLPDTLNGDPVWLELPAATFVDTRVLSTGAWTEALRVPGLGQPLLEGLDFATSPGFDVWLTMERRHLEGITESVLHEGAQARLGAGDPQGAAQLAARAVALDPLDENHQVLLVRALAAAGSGIEAARQVARCRELFRRELGAEPSAALEEAARTQATRSGPGPGNRHAARALLEAGEAAIGAGAFDAGLQCLRRAVADARGRGDDQLLAAALVAVGTALVHGARGRDEEAGVALHEALVLAEEQGADLVGAAAVRELGYVEFLRAHYQRAEAWLTRAVELAGDDDRERAAIGDVLGAVHTDTGRTAAAVSELAAAVERSERAGATKLVAWGLTMLGRARLLRGELDDARSALDRALGIAEREWVSLVPFPLAFSADVDLAAGDVDAAAQHYERAFALGCQLADPCWEGLAARGLGLVAAARGDAPSGVEWLQEARTRCLRVPDAWMWADAYIVEALCGVGLAHGLPGAPAWITELEALTSRYGMRELMARAQLHRARLGDHGAAAAAEALIADLDNPVLTDLL